MNRRESTDAAACSSKDDSFHKETVTCHEGNHEAHDIVPDVHHQYFTVATGFLKDVISESAKVGVRCIDLL